MLLINTTEYEILKMVYEGFTYGTLHQSLIVESFNAVPGQPYLKRNLQKQIRKGIVAQLKLGNNTASNSIK